MNSSQIDSLLLDELRFARCGSRLRTSLCIKLADHASQINGFRSSRQIPGDKKDEVEESFQELMDLLLICTYEFSELIEQPHLYKESVLNLTTDELEVLLEDSLYDSIIYSDLKSTFKLFFLE